ncbi:Xylose isomerase-like, TIM barrel domain protein [Acididesulfobacillus acetoxydans]|uniref:Enoyl-CoA hydratase/isomerase, conserved site n=1 Tax=Acididesulfobacillus acetoxydans TaxID=1561005 RepID=A0A8S0XVK0_9FIRM|nr:hypothetical protein [Acididesulfobacillus acetoxydans]CAA7600397.1 Xylose isomerase-like, TIM barrel domain protein [Acididesulfobacillus acetoxydans]CEJ07919.1 Enoyl-CoA hydratase/isomerase, conserved site [Acididesulfobacillus acetoxydans]
MKKLGFSLSPEMLLGRPESILGAAVHARFGHTRLLLKELKARGVSSIEIRNLPQSAPEDVGARLVETVWQAGLEVSVHGRADRAGEAGARDFTEVYPPVKELIKYYAAHQKDIIMVIHAYTGDGDNVGELRERSVGLLRSWVSLAECGEIPLRFALELTRRRAGKEDPAAGVEGVLGLVREVNSPYVGIAWDMGHYYANVLKARSSSRNSAEQELPARAFLEHTVHTHIHGLGARGKFETKR